MSFVEIPSTNGFYVVGGTMRPDAQSYVRRDADAELYTGLVENEFCHVLTARQMGKSSLMLRTASRLREVGIGVAALDLTGIGTNLSPEQWYSGLIVQLGNRLNLEDELLEFWQANVSLGPMQRWVSAIRKVVLPLHPGRLAIFVDEIDAVASLKFSTDEFFSGIRECYNLRHEDPDINRLTFCLLGVASPADLIRDTRTTPFNVGRRIELNDFTELEALPLAQGLRGSPAENHALLKRVFYWTSGHPYLTQRLCKAVADKPTSGGIAHIDEAIEQMFFSKRAREYDDNLIFVRERLLRSGADVAALLNLYSRVRRNRTVADDDSQPLASILRLSGVTRAENGRLRVRNRIYERVFNVDWVKSNLPSAEVRRQRAAFLRGVIRTTGVAVILLTIVAALAITAFRQRNRALQQTAVNNQLLYVARMKLANQEYENANMARVDELVELTKPRWGEFDLRGFEWFLFWRYAHAETLRIQEPGHIASARLLSKDMIAVAEVIHTMKEQRREYTIKLFDRRSPKQVMSFEVQSGVNFDIAVFSPDDKYVATDAPDNSVAVWEFSSGQQVHKLTGPGKPVASVVFSPDQQSLACAFVGGNFRVWDLKTGKQKLEGHSQIEKPGIAFSSNGKHLAVGMGESVTKILDSSTGRPLRTLFLPKGIPGLIFFSPDGTRFFATNDDGYIYSWDLSNGRLLEFGRQAHSNEVMSFSFSPDGTTLATGSVDRTIKFWDMATGSELGKILGHGGWVTSLHFSADGQYLLSGDNEGLIKMWDLSAHEIPFWLPSQAATSISATAFTPENQLFALGRGAEEDLKVWNLSNGRFATLGKAKIISSAAFSKDAELVAVAAASQIKIYSTRNGKLIGTLTASGVDVYSLDFSPDGTKLLSGDRQGNVIISDVSTGQTEVQLNSGNMYYRAVFSPDGKQIASADQDGKIKIWDVLSATVQKTLSGHTGVAKLLSFSPDGRLLASAADDNTVRIWDPASGKELAVSHSDPVQRFAFTPDGKRLVTASLDGAVVLWDITRMLEIITLQKGGRGKQPSSVNFSQDGLTLAVSDEGGGVKVWQAGQPNL
jgi:WD40 repeat protein